MIGTPDMETAKRVLDLFTDDDDPVDAFATLCLTIAGMWKAAVDGEERERMFATALRAAQLAGLEPEVSFYGDGEEH